MDLKELLLKDLCSRLPYGVICQFIWTYTTDGEDVIAKEDDNIKGININTKEIQADYYDEWVDLEYCKPYLRPMSSMTEEEKGEYQAFFNYDGVEYPEEYIDWLNKKMFAYRTLDGKDMFELGLALEAPEGMYKV